MTWQAALETVVAATGHQRYRELCSDDNADVEQRDAYRANVVRRASGAEAPAATPRIPSLVTQLGNAVAAVGRVAEAAVHGEPIVVSTAEYDRRMAICETCEAYDPSLVRCKDCGCFLQLKARLTTEAGNCPRTKW